MVIRVEESVHTVLTSGSGDRHHSCI